MAIRLARSTPKSDSVSGLRLPYVRGTKNTSKANNHYWNLICKTHVMRFSQFFQDLRGSFIITSDEVITMVFLQNFNQTSLGLPFTSVIVDLNPFVPPSCPC
jgi:hypothetical protein